MPAMYVPARTSQAARERKVVRVAEDGLAIGLALRILKAPEDPVG